MIREKLDIDNKLILNFIKNNELDANIDEDLLKWYAFLDDKDYEKGRKRAISFIKKIASESLLEINFPDEEKTGMLNVFNLLENLLRTAQSLNSSDKNIKVRDHLSHTIRNIIFANFIIKFYPNNKLANFKRKLNTAIIFHDIGYPIEKLKKVGNHLKDATFSDLLNSSGKVDFILSKPDDLLDMLDHLGKLSNSYNFKSKPEDNIRIRNKIEHLYKEILAPAIAGKGLFETDHNFSSVVLFLRPIVKHWINSQKYVQTTIEPICDICFSIAYHNRDMSISNFEKYDTEIPDLVKILRIADELQEWDRIKNEESFVKNAEINFLKNYLSIKYTMKHCKEKCNPNKFIEEKIISLTPIVNDDKVEITILFPDELEVEEGLENKSVNRDSNKLIIDEIIKPHVEFYTKNKKSKEVILEFYKNKVKINLK